jgi:lipoate-protein ligase A
MSWMFYNTGFHSGSFNMKFDLRLAQQLQEEHSQSVLRIYGWNPAAISIGLNQQFEDFDLSKLREAGIDIVKRPTGGKAILHTHELTYSVVMRLEQQTPKEIYRRINEGLLEGVRLLGIHAELTTADDNFRQIYREPYAVPCFTSSAKCEIQVEGKKLIGSAQRRFDTTILQHGSLLLGPEHRNIVNYFSGSVNDIKSIIEEHLLTRTTDVQAILGRTVSFEEAASAIKQGFTTALDIEFQEIREDEPALSIA